MSYPPRPKNPHETGYVKRCRICGKELSWRNEFYCTRSCTSKGTYNHVYTIDKFICSFIRDPINYWNWTEFNCWNWIGPITKSGYGCFKRNHIKAHRMAYKIFVGKIPDGTEIHHICENILCVRPDHLVALTPEEHHRLHLELLNL
jgi:hypothetical protein